MGLAERLGLHAPFRTFGSGEDELTYDSGARKRKANRRRPESLSSLLEPAENNLQLGQEDVEREELYNLSASTKDHQTHNDGTEAGSMSRVTPTKETRSYERRSRRKTRENRYNVEKDAKRLAKKPKRDDATRKEKKRKRKEKSGNTLMHDFSASNVAKDRLTVSQHMPISVELGVYTLSN